ncbi:MAG TPA: hypothetical protein VID19_10625 [Candidatus Eremiobacteraceae bacterium]
MPRPPFVNRRKHPRPLAGRQASAARVYNLALLVVLMLFAFALVFVH